MTVKEQRPDPFANMRTWRKTLQSKGWWHSFELADGTRVDGVNSVESLKKRISQFPIPEDLRGKRVLDIGAWDGWFSFELERRGAEVMAIDTWDNPRFHEMHRLLNSRVDYRQMDVYDLAPERVGRFDIVLFMGVLYHLKHPLLALERVCAVTTEMAAVDSFILRQQHMPGLDVETLPIMAYYETDEFAGQTDNWVGPNLPCLLAFCRTAGFARVDYRGMVENGACVACYRQWEPVAPTAPAGPVLADAIHNQNHGINFESGRDTYLSIFFDAAGPNLTRDDVKPQVGGYGVRPLDVWHHGSQHWQAEFKLPPGLAPGWHAVEVRVGDSRPSNALRIAVDLPIEPGPISVVGVSDGATWAPNEIDLKRGAALSLWIRGLPENADRNNVIVRLADVRLELVYVTPGLNEPRQVNAVVPPDAPAGVSELVAAIGGEGSQPVRIAVKGSTAPSSEASYDSIASEYAKLLFDELKDKPFDRKLLDSFADRVQGAGLVCDLGCGPGQLTRYLSERGVNVFGLDLSANMLREARSLNPGIQYVRGDLLSLGLRNQSLAGIAAFYSIIHVKRERVPAALGELRRALRPEGTLLLAFHLGTGTLHPTDFHGRPIDFEVTLFTLDEMIANVDAAGFRIDQASERDPYPEVEFPSRRGYIVAVNSR